MSIHFHKLKVLEVRRETPDCVSVAFKIPEKLKPTFEFRQGQSLTMRSFFDGEEVRRTYSICSSPLENEWRVAIRKVEGGLFSSFANERLRAGDELEVMPPVGKFYTELDPAQHKSYLAFAAGSGITPVISLIKTTLAIEPRSKFTLVFGNRTRSSIIFFEELEGLKNKYLDRFNLIHILSRERTDTPLHFGRVDVQKLNDLQRLVDYRGMDEIFICGPEAMIFCIRGYMENLGIEKRRIHFELFTTPGEKGPSVRKQAAPPAADAPKSHLTIRLDGRSVDFDLPFSSETTILDAALQQGADLPFACKGGVCCTCKARLIEGEVSMDVHWGLEEEEIEKGYILTCQSHPKTEKVVVDFDIRG
ncbi:MAG TPA: 1,2-phenylacetyl-CoA epoxidase subunit PaaE [Chitinophagaceae bacterium]|nr:1,2-phenylacetyl-CoA epoxidase subunit PaaE [Chitinophagaceae bacterium]